MMFANNEGGSSQLPVTLRLRFTESSWSRPPPVRYPWEPLQAADPNLYQPRSSPALRVVPFQLQYVARHSAQTFR
jgi:hypothetical protein